MRASRCGSPLGWSSFPALFGRQVSIIGSTMGSQREFVDVMKLIFAGKLAVAVDRVYPLRNAREAEERMKAGEHFGKILLEVE